MSLGGGEGTTWFLTSDIEFTRDLACTHVVLPMLGIFSLQGLDSRVEEWASLSTTRLQLDSVVLGIEGPDSVSCPLVTKTELHPINLASASVPLRLHAVHTTLQNSSKVTGMDAAHRGIPLSLSSTDPGPREATTLRPSGYQPAMSV